MFTAPSKSDGSLLSGGTPRSYDSLKHTGAFNLLGSLSMFGAPCSDGSISVLGPLSRPGSLPMLSTLLSTRLAP